MKERYLIYILLIVIIISTIILITKESKKFEYDEVVYADVYREYNEIISKEQNQINIINTDIEENTEKITYGEAKNNLRLVDSVLEIDKIDIFYPVIREMTMDNLKIAPTKFYGPDANEIGNYCIVGHNYHSEAHFSRLKELEINDIVYLTDKKGKKVEYIVYQKYEINPDDLSCLSQNNGDIREVTLITCTNDSQRRLVVKCKENRI